MHRVRTGKQESSPCKAWWNVAIWQWPTATAHDTVQDSSLMSGASALQQVLLGYA